MFRLHFSSVVEHSYDTQVDSASHLLAHSLQLATDSPPPLPLMLPHPGVSPITGEYPVPHWGVESQFLVQNM